MHDLLLVFSAVLSHLLSEAHLNPTFPLFSLPLMKETLPGRILNSLLPLDIGCFHVYLILGYYLPNSIPLLIWNSQKGSGSVLLALFPILNHTVYLQGNPHGSINGMDIQFIKVSDCVRESGPCAIYQLAFMSFQKPGEKKMSLLALSPRGISQELLACSVAARRASRPCCCYNTHVDSFLCGASELY